MSFIWIASCGRGGGRVGGEEMKRGREGGREGGRGTSYIPCTHSSNYTIMCIIYAPCSNRLYTHTHTPSHCRNLKRFHLDHHDGSISSVEVSEGKL